MFGVDNCHWFYGSRTVDMKNWLYLCKLALTHGSMPP